MGSYPDPESALRTVMRRGEELMICFTSALYVYQAPQLLVFFTANMYFEGFVCSNVDHDMLHSSCQ
jgi:hypothetical protein